MYCNDITVKSIYGIYPSLEMDLTYYLCFSGNSCFHCGFLWYLHLYVLLIMQINMVHNNYILVCIYFFNAQYGTRLIIWLPLDMDLCEFSMN